MARFFIRIHRTNNRESKSIQLYKITFSKCAISPAQYSVIKSLTAFTIAWMHMHLDARTLVCTYTWMHMHLGKKLWVQTFSQISHTVALFSSRGSEGMYFRCLSAKRVF